MEKYELQNDENSALIQKFHNVLNINRGIYTKRFIFTLPTPLTLERKFIEHNLTNFEYTVYESSFSYDSVRMVLVFFDDHVMGYTKDGKHYDLSELLALNETFKEKNNVTIVDAFLNIDKMEMYITDVIHHDHSSYYMAYFDVRKSCLVKIIEEDLDKVKTHIDVLYPNFYNYKDIVYCYDEMRDMIENDFKRVIFVPKTIPIGINIQRTMFMWEKDPQCLLKVTANEENGIIKLFAKKNYKEDEDTLFASIMLEKDEAKDFMTDYEGPGLYSLLYKNDTFKIKNKCKKKRGPNMLRYLEQFFCTYRDSITLDDIFIT